MMTNHRLFLVAGFFISVQVGIAFAQYQVNTQVNTGIYAGPNVGSMQYSGQNASNNPLLPSQNRYEVMQSGQTPSELRAGAYQAGRLAPGGITTITQAGTPLSRAQGAAPQAPSGPMAAPTGSMQYSGYSPPSRPASPWSRRRGTAASPSAR